MAPETDITCEMIPNRAGYGGKTRRTGKIRDCRAYLPAGAEAQYTVLRGERVLPSIHCGGFRAKR